jgi:hypothetical protein
MTAVTSHGGLKLIEARLNSLRLGDLGRDLGPYRPFPAKSDFFERCGMLEIVAPCEIGLADSSVLRVSLGQFN